MEEIISEKKKKNNIDKALELFQSIRKPMPPKGGAMCDTDDKKRKRSDRGVKYKKDYSKED